MTEFLHKLFSSDFMGHGYCYLWKPEIVWLHAISDGLIALSYYFIPVILVSLVRKRRDLPFHWVFFMFGVFILGCGTTHAMEIWTLWNGTYRLAGVIKAITAGASLATALALVPIVPRALRLPSPAQLRAANLELEKEIGERGRVEKALQMARSELELRVQQRTAELARANQELQVEIAQRRLVEETLRKQASLLDLAHEAIFVVDMNDTITYWNASAEETYGWKQEEAVGKVIQQLLNSVYPSSLGDIKTELIRQGRWEGEITQTRRDGSQIVVASRWALQRNDEGRPVATLKISTDITAHKHAEAALRESEERFRTMADAAPVMIWMSGLDKLCTFLNKSWLDFTGRAMEQGLGIGWRSDIHPDDRDRCFEMYSSSFDARRNFQVEFRLRRADGEYRWVLNSGVPRVTPDKGFAGYIGSGIDITDVKRSQEQALARQKLESVGALAGGIAHDFNNLLGGILAQAELVEADLTAGSAPSEEIQRIKTAAIRGAEIVRELMIYAGQDKTDLVEAVGVSRLVEEMLDLLKVSIPKHTILKTDLQTGLPGVWGNASQIRQVVMNLVINASEAIGEQEGVISVTTTLASGSTDLAPSSATGLPPGDYVRLEVADTGRGVAEEVKARIFDPFFSTKFAGRGLGLAVVQGIVRNHGGAINLMSAPGEGTTVQVLLPCTPAKVSDFDPAIKCPAVEQSHARAVLVVEDEETLRVAVAKALRNKGFSVMEASNGSDAMELLRLNKDDIDVVLLDLTLPGISSRAVFEEAQGMRPDLKVIVTSAYSKETVNACFADLRVDYFIRKPFQIGDMMRLLGDTGSV